MRVRKTTSTGFDFLLHFPSRLEEIFGQQQLKCEAGTRADNGISYRSAA